MYKKIKYIISLIITGFCIHNLYAQPINLSAEIIWKKKDLYLLNYDTVDVPFLRFNYKNNTENSIYFYNSLRYDRGDFPEYLNFVYNPGYMINYGNSNKWDGLMTSFPNWSDNEYVVTIAKPDKYRNYLSFLLYKKGETNISREVVEASDEHRILDDLMLLLIAQLLLDRDSTNLQYKVFHHPNKDTSVEKFFEYFKSLKLKTFEEQMEEFSKINVYDNCVFLNPYESFSFEYDLTPLFLLKGTYNFIINPKMPKSVVLFGNNTVLPKLHNGFKLFTGKLPANKVTIHFPNIQLKE